MTPEKKLMLWAHWSHLAYTAAGPSVGQSLRQSLGDRIYTILPVAERGSAIVIFPRAGSDEDVGYAWVRLGSDGFSSAMAASSASPFFLDLRDPAVANDAAFARDQAVWIESRSMPVRLRENVDGLVWLKRVSPPRWPMAMLLVMGGMHYRVPLVIGAVVAIALILWFLMRRRARLRVRNRDDHARAEPR